MYIDIKNLYFKYKNSHEDTIKGISLQIEKGEIVALIGESGSGKSTILRIIAGLEVPSSGEILINDKVIFDEKSFIMPEKRGIGMVFQDYALFPHMTVEQNIIFGLKSFSKQDKISRVNEVLELTNLRTYLKRYPHELSGGQQQRVALARALAPKPSLILLDEPFSNLDTDLRKTIRNDLKEILKKANMTAVFVTHDREDAACVADKIVTLYNGKIINETHKDKAILI